MAEPGFKLRSYRPQSPCSFHGVQDLREQCAVRKRDEKAGERVVDSSSGLSQL